MKEKNKISRRGMLKLMAIGTAGTVSVMGGCDQNTIVQPTTAPIPTIIPAPSPTAAKVLTLGKTVAATEEGQAASGNELQITNNFDEISLPQNLLINSGTLYEDFENVVDWTVNNGRLANNDSEYKTGTQSIKLTANSGATPTMTKTVNWDLSGDWGGLSFWIYVHSTDPGDFGQNLYSIKLGKNPGLTNAMQHYYFAHQITELNGWHRIYIPKAYFEAAGLGTFSNPIIRVQISFTAASGKTPSISFDDLEIGEKHIPAIMYRADDSNAAQYTIAYSYLKTFGIRGTWYINTSPLGRGGVNASWHQIQEMYLNGWAIGNHTKRHTPLKGLSLGDQETAIYDVIADLTSHGMPKYAKYFAYPGGGAAPGYDTNTKTALLNLGMLTAQNTQLECDPQGLTCGYVPQVLPDLLYGDLFHLLDQGFSTYTSLAQAKTILDVTIAAGCILSPLVHHPDGLGIEWSPADFQAWWDYAIPKIRLGQIAIITIDDLYKLTLGSVKVPKIR